MKKTALLGGSFNPLHNGHLFIAEEIRTELGYERIVFVPAYNAPHKSIAAGAGRADRLQMLKSAVAENPSFICDDVELERKGTSYTVDTVRYIASEYDTAGRVGLIIGDDLLEGFHTWKEAGALAEMTSIIVLHRETSQRKPFVHDHVYIENTILPISSSEIRNRIRSGKAFRYLVPEPVYRYIKAHELYRI